MVIPIKRPILIYQILLIDSLYYQKLPSPANSIAQSFTNHQCSIHLQIVKLHSNSNSEHRVHTQTPHSRYYIKIPPLLPEYLWRIKVIENWRTSKSHYALRYYGILVSPNCITGYLSWHWDHRLITASHWQTDRRPWLLS